MKDDTQLLALGEAEREDQAVPERWRRLVEGRASAEEIAALEAEAAQDPAAAALWARFRPLEPDVEAKIAHAALAHRTRGRRTGRMAIAGGLLAAAAGVLLTLADFGEAQLPQYRLEASTPDLEHRGAAAPAVDRPVHHPGSAVTLVLRPARPAEADLAVDSYLSQDGDLEQVELPWRLSEAGAARLEIVPSERFAGRSGDLTLVAVVRPTGASPLPAEAARGATRAEAEARGVRVLEYPFRLVGR